MLIFTTTFNFPADFFFFGNIKDKKYFTCGQLSHKPIVNNLKRLKEIFIVVFLVF